MRDVLIRPKQCPRIYQPLSSEEINSSEFEKDGLTLTKSLTNMANAEWGVQSAFNIAGTRFSNIQEPPAAVLMISYNDLVSRPSFDPNAIASAATAICTPASNWLMSFTEEAAPTPPSI